MYAPLTGDEFGRTLVGVAWSDPKAETHTDFLRQEMARACLEADVDLSEVAIDVGSAVAARALRASARGVGARGDERTDAGVARGERTGRRSAAGPRSMRGSAGRVRASARAVSAAVARASDASARGIRDVDGS